MATGVEEAVDATPNGSLMVLAQLAAALTRPLSTFTPVNTVPLLADQLEALGKEPHFRQPLQRFYYQQYIGDQLTLTLKQARRLPVTPAGRLAVSLLVEPVPMIEQAALLVSGAAMQQQVLQTIQKPGREHLRTVLGPAAFQVAALEAPMLYPSLARHGNAKLLASILDQDEATARGSFVSLGMGLLGAAAATASRSLALLALKRLVSIQAPIQARSLTAGFSIHDKQSVMRLLQRRMSPWTASIG